jgi:hypothetical protein
MARQRRRNRIREPFLWIRTWPFLVAVAPFHLRDGRPTFTEGEHGRPPSENPLGAVNGVEDTTEDFGPQGSRATPLTARPLFWAPRATQRVGLPS